MADTVEFFGESFEVPERVNTRRLTRFARLASQGANTDDAGVMAEVDKLIDACLLPGDLDRFDKVCDEHAPSAEELMKFIADVMAAVGGRPTQRSSDSSDGPKIVEPSSTDDSSSEVIARLEAEGRADKAEFVVLAERERKQRTA